MVKTSLFPSTYNMLKKKKEKDKIEQAPAPAPTFVEKTGTGGSSAGASIAPGTLETFTDPRTGRASGVTMPDGRTFLGLSPEDVNMIAQGEAQRVARPENSAPVGTAQAQLEKQQILSQLGQVTGVSQARLNELIDEYNLTGKGQFQEGLPGALREGTTQAVTRGLSYGAAAAGVGLIGGPAAPVTVPVAAAIGVGAGIVSGYWSALRKAKKSEAKEDVGNAMAEFQQIRRGLSQVGSLTSSGLINEVEAVELYNAQLTRMLEIEAQVKYLQDTNLKDYLSDGSDDLAQISTYLTQVAPAYKMRIQSSLMNPTAKVPYSDIILEDMASLE